MSEKIVVYVIVDEKDRELTPRLENLETLINLLFYRQSLKNNLEHLAIEKQIYYSQENYNKRFTFSSSYLWAGWFNSEDTPKTILKKAKSRL